MNSVSARFAPAFLPIDGIPPGITSKLRKLYFAAAERATLMVASVELASAK